MQHATATRQDQNTIGYYLARGFELAHTPTDSGFIFVWSDGGETVILSTNRNGIEYGKVKLTGSDAFAAVPSIVDAIYRAQLER